MLLAKRDGTLALVYAHFGQLLEIGVVKHPVFAESPEGVALPFRVIAGPGDDFCQCLRLAVGELLFPVHGIAAARHFPMRLSGKQKRRSAY